MSQRRGWVIERVCIIGGGVIGSLFAGHLAQVADVSVLTRRRDHAEALNREGLRISGRSELHVTVHASHDPAELEPFDLGIVATKSTGLEQAAATLEGHVPEATMMTTLNGLGAEAVVRAHGDWPIISAVTFMSGTRHSDTHVEYILDTETWLGPYEDTPYERVEEAAALIERPVFTSSPCGPTACAVVEADLQRDGQLRRGAHGPAARSSFRCRGQPNRPRPSRPRTRRRGESRRRRRRDRVPRRPVGDERARDETRVGALSIDAGGRRST